MAKNERKERVVTIKWFPERYKHPCYISFSEVIKLSQFQEIDTLVVICENKRPEDKPNDKYDSLHTPFAIPVHAIKIKYKEQVQVTADYLSEIINTLAKPLTHSVYILGPSSEEYLPPIHAIITKLPSPYYQHNFTLIASHDEYAADEAGVLGGVAKAAQGAITGEWID